MNDSSPFRIRPLSVATACAMLLTFAPDALAQAPGPDEPLAGIAGDQAFLRSPDNTFVLLPSGRLQVDSYLFARPTPAMPENTVLLRRARLELAGWIGPVVHFSIAGDFAAGPPASPDPVAQSFLATTDDFVGLAPCDDLVVFQAGQFDAPFTLENRTSDKYIDFMERSLTVRAFAVPTNKELGLMVHGAPKDRLFYYSLGVFNGDGQNFKNVDANGDFMARAWVAPFVPTDLASMLRLTVGGSAWVGARGLNANPLASQSTQGGFKYLDPKFTLPDGVTAAELHQYGDLHAFAFELDAALMHRFGARFELVSKHQDLAEADETSASSGKIAVLSRGGFDGTAFYGEVYGWVVGDDRILPAPGLQLPSRLGTIRPVEQRHGLMIAARIDRLHEAIRSDSAALADPNVGTLDVLAPEIGVNYWYTKRFRATANYVANFFEGTNKTLPGTLGKNGNSHVEHEFLFRLGIAL